MHGNTCLLFSTPDKPVNAAVQAKTPPSNSQGLIDENTSQVTRRPEVVDDFFRNFCVKMGLEQTLNMFETEWYELKATGKLRNDPGTLPDVYLHNAVCQSGNWETSSKVFVS